MPDGTEFTPTMVRRRQDAGTQQSGYVVSPHTSPPFAAGTNPLSALRVGFSNSGFGGPYFIAFNAGGQPIFPAAGQTAPAATQHYTLDPVSTWMKEPYIGEELIRIQLEAYDVHFVFTDTVLQIGASFSLAAKGSVLAAFNPIERKGELDLLWALVGQTVKSVSWGDHVEIIFESGSEIWIPPVSGYIRGSIVGRHKRGIDTFWEDF